MTKLNLLEDFGQVNGEAVKRVRLDNGRVRLTLISYGAAIQALEVYDESQSKWIDLVLGFDTLEAYRACETNRPSNPFFGATVGRVANVIVDGKFSLDETNYELDLNNNGKHFLHGGLRGFDQRNWHMDISRESDKVTFSLLSLDKDQKLPGDLVLNVSYSLSEKDEVNIDIVALTTKPTPINIVNHSYFNLGGHDGGSSALYDHVAVIDGDRYVFVEGDRRVTGELRSVKMDNDYDLRVGRRLNRQLLDQLPTGGFDRNFCLEKSTAHFNNDITRACRLIHLPTGRSLTVYTDQPGLQLYTGNFMPEEKAIEGKGKAEYRKHGGFCVETQNFPDAVNHSNFPNPILRPGNIYKHKMILKLDF